MNRRKFIKALPILAGAAVVIPKVLFAKPLEIGSLLPVAVKHPKGLTMAKLLKAKRILDAAEVPGPNRYLVWVNDNEQRWIHLTLEHK